jgi:hypothetical protein
MWYPKRYANAPNVNDYAPARSTTRYHGCTSKTGRRANFGSFSAMNAIVMWRRLSAVASGRKEYVPTIDVQSSQPLFI